jgi:hypothetical protein
MQETKCKQVPFEVIEVWYNDIYTPYTFKPTSNDSELNYAIKIGNEVFLLGDSNQGIHICDFHD